MSGPSPRSGGNCTYVASGRVCGDLGSVRVRKTDNKSIVIASVQSFTQGPVGILSYGENDGSDSGTLENLDDRLSDEYRGAIAPW